MKLYSFWRSSAAFRARIALGLKGIDYELVPVHLRRKDQAAPEYSALNPQQLVPMLIDGPHVLTQSLAICEYLHETRPGPPLLPADPIDRARVRALAQSLACEIHPLANLRVLRYLGRVLGQDDAARAAWIAHWTGTGLAALEKAVGGDPRTGTFCHGDVPGLADLCLVPQWTNAETHGVPLDGYPTLARIVRTCRTLDAFHAAAPENQPDAE